MSSVNEATPRRKVHRLIAIAVLAGAAAVASVATATANLGWRVATPPTTALGGRRPALVAILRPGQAAWLASEGSALIQGRVLQLPGIEGSDWNAFNPRHVVFDLEAGATVAQIEQVVHALTEDRAVQSVSVSIPG